MGGGLAPLFCLGAFVVAGTWQFCVCMFFFFPEHPRRLIMNGLFVTNHIISRLSRWLKKFEYKAAFTARPSDDKTRLRAGSIGSLGSCRGARATKGSTESLSFGPSARP